MKDTENFGLIREIINLMSDDMWFDTKTKNGITTCTFTKMVCGVRMETKEILDKSYTMAILGAYKAFKLGDWSTDTKDIIEVDISKYIARGAHINQDEDSKNCVFVEMPNGKRYIGVGVEFYSAFMNAYEQVIRWENRWRK